MKMQMDLLLRASLAPYANYNEKQLLKAGQLGKCASQILQRRRRTTQLYAWFFMLVIVIPIVLQLLSLIFPSSDRPDGMVFSQFCFISLLQVPILIEMRLSQTRLETLIAMWLLTEHDDLQGEPDSESRTLAQLVFANQ